MQWAVFAAEEMAKFRVVLAAKIVSIFFFYSWASSIGKQPQ